MRQTTSAPPAAHTAARVSALPTVVGLALLLAGTIGVAIDQAMTAHPTASTGSPSTPVADPNGIPSRTPPTGIAVPAGGIPGVIGDGRIRVADGALPEGATVLDDYPGVQKLEAALLDALRRAAEDAAGDDIEIQVTSGWRSGRYQDALLQAAIDDYGSLEEAARWVATAATSPHVSGDAVDVGPSDAAAWLSRHGSEYGLCQIYRNEPWHFELRAETTHRGCPRMYADPSRDPRMQP